MHWKFALLISLIVSPAAFADPVPAPHLYGVVFEVTADGVGKIDTIVISKVIDPATGTTDPINLSVPSTYVTAAREWLRQRTYKPGSHFFTYTFFDPLRPTKADIDPNADQS
jgi:hypothetical protein